jgi:hypothetical protein
MSCSSTYCISNTGLVGADDNYITGGTYNGKSYWTGQTSGWTMYYYTGTTSYWCLSSTLGGPCYLTGKYPCVSSCPDLSNIYVYSGMCPTPTPTPTQNCDVLDFTALFNCEVELTPTPTPTSSITPTPTITPSSTNFCSIIGIDASGYTYTPTPTPTPTNTPTTSLPVYRGCNFSGNVEFNLIDDNIVCVTSSKYQNCITGEVYYTTNQLSNPSTGPILKYMVFSAYVNKKLTCIMYLGTDYSKNGIDNIVLVSGDYGYNDKGCFDCNIANLPTPTMTPTMTNTPTPTMTPTPTHNICNPNNLSTQSFKYPSILKNNGINSDLSYSIYLYYKLSGTTNSCYKRIEIPLIAGYPEYSISPGNLTNTFTTGETYDIYVTNSQTPTTPIKFGTTTSDFTSYCGITSPAQVTIPLTSGLIPFHINVNVLFNPSLNKFTFENC